MTKFPTAHVDTFVLDNLPSKSEWPELIIELPELNYPEHLNAAEILLQADANQPAIFSSAKNWTYGDLRETANKIANALVNDMDFVPGNRVLLHSPNCAMQASCWLAILLAGGVVVATMPMLRTGELVKIISKAEISHVLCHAGLVDEITSASEKTKNLKHIKTFDELEKKITGENISFSPIKTFAHDPALLAFTSGTTGVPKACIHFHRDIMAMADTFSRHILQPQANEIFASTAPLSFTFGLGGLLVFPFHAEAATVLNETVGIDGLAKDIEKFKVTTLFTSPTAYRALLGFKDQYDFSSLQKCVSAGETLSKATSDAWFETTGIRLIDGIGSTEMIHIFISASGDDIRPGATGRPVPGYRACVLDEKGEPLPNGSTGRLAVKGPTGCRYLNDERQKDYVVNGWNVTGDTYHQDEDGYFWFKARSDDIIVSGGYNIAGPEVEDALLSHDQVFECAVIGAPDQARGHIAKAFVVLKEKDIACDELAKTLQDYVKATIAPYKYPRAIKFVDSLPKTETGKIQRFKLREMEEHK